MDNLGSCCCCLSNVDVFRRLSKVGILWCRNNSNSLGFGLISGAVFDLNLNEDQRFLPATSALLDLMVEALSFCLCCCCSWSSRGAGDLLASLSSALAELASTSPSPASPDNPWVAGVGILEEPSINSKPFSIDEELLNKPTVVSAIMPSASPGFGGASIEELLCSECSLVSDKLSPVVTNGNEHVTSMSGGARDGSTRSPFSTFALPCEEQATSDTGEGETRRLFWSLLVGGDGLEVFSALTGLGAGAAEFLFLLTGVVEDSRVYSTLSGLGGSAVDLLDTDVDTLCVLSMPFELRSCAEEVVFLLSSADVCMTSVLRTCVVEFAFLLFVDCVFPITAVLTFLDPVALRTGWSRVGVPSTSLLVN